MQGRIDLFIRFVALRVKLMAFRIWHKAMLNLNSFCGLFHRWINSQANRRQQGSTHRAASPTPILTPTPTVTASPTPTSTPKLTVIASPTPTPTPTPIT